MVPTSGGKIRRIAATILVLMLVSITWVLVQYNAVITYDMRRTTAINEKSITESTMLNAQPQHRQQQQQQQHLLSKVLVTDTKKLPESSQGLPQYSVARLIHHNYDDDDRGGEGERTTTVNNTMPPDLMLLDDKLLWCQNAKAGTTSMYTSIIHPMNFTTSKGMKAYERCYDWNDCKILASRIYKQNPNKVMRAPSFTIVRNPWDRIRSCYKEKIASKWFFDLSPEHPKGLEGMKKKYKNSKYKKESQVMTFVEFIDHVAKYPTANDHWEPHSMHCRTVKDEYGQIFHYDHIVKIEDGMFPQVEAIFNLYNLPYPSNEPKIRGTITSPSKSASLQVVESNNNTSAKTPAAAAEFTTTMTATTTTTGSIDGDTHLINFYREAASVANISMEELIERVRLVYEHDVKLYDYSFPSYQ